MALGVCCQWLEPGNGYGGHVNVFGSRCLQFGRYESGKYSDEFLRQVYVENAHALLKISHVIVKNVGCFRISSGLMPLADRVSRDLWDNQDVVDILRQAGHVFMSAKCRLTIHPGQFCVLSSDDDDIVKHAVDDLSIQAWLLDSMGIPRDHTATINVHGGKKDRAGKLLRVIDWLPDGVRSRLTLENDESCYSARQLCAISASSGIPVVLDSHHHSFNDDGLSLDDAHGMTSKTWPTGFKPIQHISNTDQDLLDGSFAQRRKHSDYIYYVPTVQLEAARRNDIDLEVECKMKNIGVMRMRSEFDIAF